MSTLSTLNLSLAYGERDIFSNLSVELPRDSRVGLVGPNGVGKTSFFRVLAGLLPPTAGSVRLARDARIGYLRQEAVEAFAGHEHSVYDEMLTVFSHLRAQEAAMRALEVRMAEGDVGEEVLHEYSALQEAFDQAGGYDYEVRIRQVLEGLQFPEGMWHTAISHLSGGQKTRALLARLLLERPNLLVLDEPTNHLDIQAVEWLEKTLREWDGALLIASHDRYFLDAVVNRIWEMSPAGIEAYRGNYSAYLQQRQERWERNQEIFEREMERMWAELELIKRYLVWKKLSLAWGKMRLLTRDILGAQRYGVAAAHDMSFAELDLHRVKMFTVAEAHAALKAIRPPVRPPKLALHLKGAPRGGQIVLRAERVLVGYPGKRLFSVDELLLERGERVALIGPNGSGKTTFLKTILGQIAPLSGEVRLGAGLHIGYFAQAHDSLDPNNSVLDELLRHRDMLIPQARNHLAQYLFRGDDVFKPVRALSGGERGRLALAILAVEGVNVLLLDEPTNHLDIPAQEVLQEGLEQFPGTILMVSHDRYLVSGLATQIWEPRDGKLTVFEGTYEEYLDDRDRRQVAQREEQRVQREQRRDEARQDREERRRLQMLASLEEQIAAAEAALAACTRSLETCGDSEEVTRLADSYTARQAELDRLMQDWTVLAEQ